MISEAYNVASPLKRLQPQKVLRAVNFICQAPDAQGVSVVGDFNNWDETVHPMRRQPDGAWLTQIELKHGHHRYVFLVDGQGYLDPRAQGVARSDDGQKVSLVAVS